MRRSRQEMHAVGRGAIVVALALAAPLVAQAQSSGPIEQMVNESDAALEADPSDPMGGARGVFFNGRAQLKRAEKLAAKAEKASGDARAQLAAEAKSELEGAVQSFSEAIGGGFRFPDVYVALGEALRALGRHEEALQVHTAALERDPKSDDNFRGYVATLLAMNRLGQLAALHDQLRTEQPKRAKIVYEALRRFQADRQRDPAGLAPADLDRLAAWLAERAKV